MRCYISTAAYHAYWRHRGVWRATRRVAIILCVVTGAAVIGGGPTVASQYFWPTAASEPVGHIPLTAP